MEVILFNNFSKRRNSTKRPNDSEGIVIDVKLKDKCSFLKPSFFITNAEAIVYIKAWGKYYFVDSVEWDIYGASYINCSIDVLASFKTEILNTSAYVKYSSSNYDANIIDDRITQLISSDYDCYDYDYSEIPLFYWSGCFIMTVTNDNRGLTNYVMNNQTLFGLLHDINNLSSSVIGEWVLKYGSLWNSIINLRWIPILSDSLPKIAVDEEIEIGGLNFELRADVLPSQPRTTRGMKVTIPWRYTDFRRYSSFTNIFLTLPFIGKVELDPSELIGITELDVNYNINPITGSCVVVVSHEESFESRQIIGTYSATIGRSIPISSTSIDAEGAIAGAVTVVAGMAGMEASWLTDTLTEEAFLQTAKNSANGALKGMLAQLKKSTTTIGTYSGNHYETIIGSPIIEVISRHSRTEPSELTDLYGRPCAKVLQISTLSGYVETKGFSIDISAQDSIKTLINKTMDSGVYLE